MAMDDWVKKAMRDDAVVAEFLICIKRSESISYINASSFVRWGAKRPRSGRHGGAAASAGSWRRKEDEKVSTRCSPMTPFSWSSGTSSNSVTAGDGEECTSTAVHSHPHAKSKAIATRSNTGKSASSKELKRKREIENKNANKKQCLLGASHMPLKLVLIHQHQRFYLGQVEKCLVF